MSRQVWGPGTWGDKKDRWQSRGGEHEQEQHNGDKHPEIEGTSLNPVRNENYSHVLWTSHRYVQIIDFLRVLSWYKTVRQTDAAI